jgi:hypothetical protein
MENGMNFVFKVQSGHVSSDSRPCIVYCFNHILTILKMGMVKPTRSFTETDNAIALCRSMFSSLKLNMSIGGSKSKNAHFHNHFVASMRLVDVSQHEI